MNDGKVRYSDHKKMVPVLVSVTMEFGEWVALKDYLARDDAFKETQKRIGDALLSKCFNPKGKE